MRKSRCDPLAYLRELGTSRLAPIAPPYLCLSNVHELFELRTNIGAYESFFSLAQKRKESAGGEKDKKKRGARGRCHNYE